MGGADGMDDDKILLQFIGFNKYDLIKLMELLDDDYIDLKKIIKIKLDKL